MRKAIVLACLLPLLATGCFGPNSLTRGFDDWTNQQFVDSPWLGQVLLYTGIIPVAYAVTYSVDMCILNVIDFWGESAFRGTGTPYIHRNPAVPEPR